jgi:hypothetical protein
VGFYGGVNYGYGYTGVGFAGARWVNNAYHYNTSVTNVNTTIVHNTYNETVINNTTVINNRVSYNGGAGGVHAVATPSEYAAMHERHAPPTAMQAQHFHAASQDHSLQANFNNGHPPVAATPHPGAFNGPGVVAAHPGEPHGDAPGNPAAHHYGAPGNSGAHSNGTPGVPAHGYNGANAYNGAPGNSGAYSNGTPGVPAHGYNGAQGYSAVPGSHPNGGQPGVPGQPVGSTSHAPQPGTAAPQGAPPQNPQNKPHHANNSGDKHPPAQGNEKRDQP